MNESYIFVDEASQVTPDMLDYLRTHGIIKSPTSELLELAARAIRPESDYNFYPSPLHHRHVYGQRDPSRARDIDWNNSFGLYAQLQACREVIEPLGVASLNILELTRSFYEMRERRRLQEGSDYIARVVEEAGGYREPVTQAKIDRVFGLNDEAQAVVDDLTEKGRNRIHAARLLKRWWYAHPEANLDDEAKFLATLKDQGFEL